MSEEYIQILTATMTGTAEIVSEEIQEFLADHNVQCEVSAMDTFEFAMLQNVRYLLVCTSTTGTGEVPDNGLKFLEHLKSGSPDLTHLRFGICGLGDSEYKETFNAGGAQFEDALIACGATKVGDRMMHDASSGIAPEDQALEWCEEWLRLYEGHAAV